MEQLYNNGGKLKMHTELRRIHLLKLEHEDMLSHGKKSHPEGLSSFCIMIIRIIIVTIIENNGLHK